MALAEGAIVGSALINALSQSYTNKANINANLLRFASETELANTAHQREVADLRAAGLNPILSTGTAGAAIPSQQAAQVEAPSVGDLGMLLSNARMTDAQVANVTQNLAINEPQAQAAKVLNDFYKTDRGREILKDKAILESAPSNAYESAYLAMRRLPDALGNNELEKYLGGNPSSAKPTTSNTYNNHSKRSYNFNFMMHNAFRDAYDPRWRNPDGLRLH